MNKELKNTSKKPNTQMNLCSAFNKTLGKKSPKGQEDLNNENSSYTQDKGNAKRENSTKKKKERKKGNINNNDNIKTVLKKMKKTSAFLPKALQSTSAYEKGIKKCETCNMDKETYKSILKTVKMIELIVDDIISKEQKEMLDKDKEDMDKPNVAVSTKGEKKIMIQFEVYCQKNIDHNLKCVLLKLQRAVGDTLLQLCYCKWKKNSDDEKCKMFDVSVNIIEHLKFELANATNGVAQLFQGPPSKPISSSAICLACIKEEIADCTEILERMLRNGRRLKVMTRNDGDNKDKCCSRDYPHVHALVQDKHIVLKFDLPFEVTSPGTGDNVDAKRSQDSAPAREPAGDGFSTSSNKAAPETDKASGNRKQDEDNESLVSKSGDDNSKDSPSTDGKPHDKANRKPDDEKPEDKYCGCNFDEVYELLKQNQNERGDNSQQPQPLNVLLTPTGENMDNVDSIFNQDVKENKKKSDSGSQAEQSKGSIENSSSSDENTSEEESESSESTEIETQKKNTKDIYFIQKITHPTFKKLNKQSESKLRKESSDQNRLLDSPKASNQQISNHRESFISAVDSVILVKNKNSISRKSRTSKDFKVGQISENPYLNTPQQILRTEIGSADLKRKSSRSLNKEQVSEVLIDLGARKLISDDFSTERSDNNIADNDFKCISDLPFSVSLHSLPLDKDDLDHITQAVKKFMSDEDIVLVPDCDDEWEIEYAGSPDDKKDHKPEWHKVITARDPHSNICIEIQTDKPISRRRLPRRVSQKEPKTLPTIKEESVLKLESKYKFENMNHVSRHRPTVNRNTEIRFFTVEYPNVVTKTKTFKHDYRDRKAKSKSYYYQKYKKHLDRYFKINPQLNSSHKEDFKTGYISDDDILNFCCSPVVTQISNSRTLENNRRGGDRKCSLNPLDKMLMLEVIYLDSNAKFKNINFSKASKHYSKNEKFSRMKFRHGFDRKNSTVNNTTAASGKFRSFSKPSAGCDAKIGLSQQNKQKSSGEICTPLASKNTLENETYWVISGSSENFHCNNIKCNVTNPHASVGLVKGEVSSTKILRNKSPQTMSFTMNTSEVSDVIKVSNDNDNIPYTVTNKSLKAFPKVLDTKESFINKNTDAQEKCKLKSVDNVSRGSKFKTKNNYTTERKMLADINKKEKTLVKTSNSKYKSAREKEVTLNRQNRNFRSCFMRKKPVKKKETSDMKFDIEVDSGSELREETVSILEHEMNINVDNERQTLQPCSTEKSNGDRKVNVMYCRSNFMSETSTLNSRKDIYTPSNNNTLSYGSLFTAFDKSLKNIWENQTHWNMSGSIENLTCDGNKCNLINGKSLIYVETVGKRQISGGKSVENDENKELRNNISAGIFSVVNFSENRDGIELLNSNGDIQPTKAALRTVLNCEIQGKQEIIRDNNKTVFSWEDLKENCSKSGFKVTLGYNVKAKSKCRHEQELFLGFNEKEEPFQQFSTLDDKSYFICKKPSIQINDATESNFETGELKGEKNGRFKHKMVHDIVKEKQASPESLECVVNPALNVKRDNLDHGSHFTLKKPVMKIVEDLNNCKDKTHQWLRKKPTFINAGARFKSVKFEIRKPEVKFPRIINNVYGYENPLLVMSPKNRKTSQKFGMMTKLRNLENVHNDLTSHQNHILEKSCCDQCKNSFIIAKYPSSSSFQLTTSLVDIQAKNNSNQSFFNTYEKIFHSFNANGEPPTDSTVGPLRISTSEPKFESDDDGFPEYDLSNSLDFYSSGRSVEDLNPVEVSYSEFLQRIAPVRGPVVLYDCGGLPLFNVSTTVLTSSVSKGLWRFECSPNCPYRGANRWSQQGCQQECQQVMPTGMPTGDVNRGANR